MDYISVFNLFVGASMIVVQAAIVFLVVLLVAFRGKVDHPLFGWISKNALWIGFIFSFGALVGSLIYSDVMGFEPCTLCWIQRILMYPQALLFAVALFKKDRGIIDYSIALSVVGTLVGLNHKMVEMTNFSLIPCSSTAVSCSKIYVELFGYITIPVMSLTVFAFLLVIMIIARRNDRALARPAVLV